MRKLVVILAFFASLSSLPAMDLGFGLDSVSGITETGAVLGWSESIRLSGLLSLGSGDAFRFLLSGWGSLDLDGIIQPVASVEPVALGGNLDRLEVRFALSRPDAALSTTLRLGRIAIDDPASSYSPLRVDGISVELGKAQTEFLFIAGYTGFLSAKDASISLTLQDAMDLADPSVYFASPRAFGMASLRMIELIGPMDLALSFGGQADLRASALAPLHGLWAQLLLDGALGGGFQAGFSADASFQGDSLQSLSPAFLAGLRLGWNATSGLALGLQADMATGDGEAGGLVAWKPMRRVIAGTSFAEDLSGLYLARISARLPFAGMFEAGASVAGYGLLGDGIADPDFTGGPYDWLGEEITADIVAKPMTDLFLNLGASLFLPSLGLAYTPSAMPRWGISLSASLEF